MGRGCSLIFKIVFLIAIFLKFHMALFFNFFLSQRGLKLFSDSSFCFFTLVGRLTQREKCPYSGFFWSVFSRIWTKYREILRFSPVTSDTKVFSLTFLSNEQCCSCNKRRLERKTLLCVKCSLFFLLVKLKRIIEIKYMPLFHIKNNF